MAAPSGRGNNLDSVRQHNLSTVLSIVHRQGPASRSQLTVATGLNRSTVGALVGELVELGLVRESDPAVNSRVGRPSPVVAAEPRVVAIAVNPEIDAVTVGVVGLDGTVLHRVRHVMADTVDTGGAREAARVAAAVLRSLQTAAATDTETEATGAWLPVGIGVAVPGLVQASDGLVRLAPHLNWVDEPFAEELRELTGLPVAAANDARLGADAERLFGAGRGVSNLIYLNGGASGIGGGVIAGGRLLTGSHGYAGELGHTLVNSAGVLCRCGARGCLETEVSQAALLSVLGLEDGDEDAIGSALALALADPADTAVRAEVDRQLGFLATALRGAANVFDPSLIVLGGFLGLLFEARPDALKASVAGQTLAASADEMVIARAELGANLLMVGAAELAFRPLLADPASFA